MATELDSTLSRYISMVHSFPMVTREQEGELMQRWRANQDEQARDALVRSHLRYVVAIALNYRRYGVPINELIAEGNFGVVHALQKFELERGTRFVTYAAYWIRAYVLNHIIRSWSLVGVGAGALRSKMFFKLRRERAKVVNLVGEGEQADELLAQTLKLPQQKISHMVRRLEARDVSLQTTLHEGSATTLADTLPSVAESQEDVLITAEVAESMRKVVHDAVSHLDQRERYIVEQRLMAQREDELSLAEIGRRLGVSRERARQLEARAIRKLRQHFSDSPEAAWMAA